MALSAIELFSGTGMLGEGIRAGLAYLGIGYRTICHVEREAHAASVLVARMEEGSLDKAAVWSDVTTFDAAAWRGKVDCIVAGFPCQDISVAGRRAGLDGERSGLFFEIPRIADACGAWLIFLENVAGIASATATVVDEAEGELEERAAARVVGELADLGWNAEWLVVSASDVGASHGRDRWFCLAWRMGYAGHFAQRHGVAGTTSATQEKGKSRLLKPADTERVLGAEVANTSSARLQIRGRRRGDDRALQQAERSELGGICGLFAPGPSDPRWFDILDEFPEVAPALEPDFRSVVNGLAFAMDDCRAARLKCVGNGVVALCAATAFVLLARRAGIIK